MDDAALFMPNGRETTALAPALPAQVPTSMMSWKAGKPSRNSCELIPGLASLAAFQLTQDNKNVMLASAFCRLGEGMMPTR